jgi:hypothetical protein
MRREGPMRTISRPFRNAEGTARQKCPYCGYLNIAPGKNARDTKTPAEEAAWAKRFDTCEHFVSFVYSEGKVYFCFDRHLPEDNRRLGITGAPRGK